jgi:acylphosphatase
MRSRAHVIATGRVQGVAFRYYTKQRALSLGIKGWVRNLSDGAVECEFEGPREALEKMIAFCREGPRLAKVTHVKVEWLEYSGVYHDFRVRI